jgi:hypothetical protein
MPMARRCVTLSPRGTLPPALPSLIGLLITREHKYADVAQVYNLLYRRLPVGKCGKFERVGSTQRFAGWKPAIQQVVNLRYERGTRIRHRDPEHAGSIP